MSLSILHSKLTHTSEGKKQNKKQEKDTLENETTYLGQWT